MLVILYEPVRAVRKNLQFGQHEVGLQEFKPFGQLGGDGFVAGHGKTIDRRLLIKLR